MADGGLQSVTRFARAGREPEFIRHCGTRRRSLNFSQTYTLADGRNLPDDKVLEYASNAAIMNAFRRCWDAHVSKRQRTGKKGSRRQRVLARAAASASAVMSDRFNLSLPGTPGGLQMKCAEYVATVMCALISGKYPERQRRQGLLKRWNKPVISPR